MPAPPAVNAGLHVEGAAGLPPLAVGMAEYAGPTSDSIASWRLNTQSRSRSTATLRWSSALRSFWWPSQPPGSSKRVLKTKTSKVITICSCQIEPGVSVSKSNEWVSAGNSYFGTPTRITSSLER